MFGEAKRCFGTAGFFGSVRAPSWARRVVFAVVRVVFWSRKDNVTVPQVFGSLSASASGAFTRYPLPESASACWAAGLGRLGRHRAPAAARALAGPRLAGLLARLLAAPAPAGTQPGAVDGGGAVDWAWAFVLAVLALGLRTIRKRGPREQA